MDTRHRPVGRRCSRPAATCVVAAIALAAVQIEIWGFWVVDEQGPKPVAAVFGLLMAGALAWCRTRR